jgi:hypothetical protein
VERLESQAQRINQLSAELEAAVLELKAIASVESICIERIPSKAQEARRNSMVI